MIGKNISMVAIKCSGKGVALRIFPITPRNFRGVTQNTRGFTRDFRGVTRKLS